MSQINKAKLGVVTNESRGDSAEKSLKIICQCTCVVSQEVSQNLEGWQSLIKMQKKWSYTYHSQFSNGHDTHVLAYINKNFPKI